MRTIGHMTKLLMVLVMAATGCLDGSADDEPEPDAATVGRYERCADLCPNRDTWIRIVIDKTESYSCPVEGQLTPVICDPR